MHRILKKVHYWKSNTFRRIAQRKKHGRHCKGGRAGKSWSDAGWRRNVAGQGSTVSSHCSFQLAFAVWVEEWPECEKLKPKPKAKWTFVDKKREGIEPSGVLTWKGQQVT